MQCITIKEKGSSEPSSTKNQDLETANRVLPSQNINGLFSRTLRDRPENEDRIRGMAEEPEECPDTEPGTELPIIFSSSEYEQLIHFPGVTDAHRVWIDKMFEAGIFVMEGGEPGPALAIEEA